MGRKTVGIYVDPEIDRGIEHLAVDTGRTKSELYELGARILLDLVTMKTLGTETANKLEELQAVFEETITTTSRG